MATERLNDVWLIGATWWQGCRELLLRDNWFCKAMAVSQAFVFHFKCYSIFHFAVCQLLCWAILLDKSRPSLKTPLTCSSLSYLRGIRVSTGIINSLPPANVISDSAINKQMATNQSGPSLWQPAQPSQWASHTSISDVIGSIDVDTDHNDPFTIEERRARRKRLRKSRTKLESNVVDSQLPVWFSVRQLMSVSSNKPATKTNLTGVGISHKKAVNKPIRIGNKISPGNNGHHSRAAKSWTNFTEKAVYCIDNVGVDTSAEELIQFV